MERRTWFQAVAGLFGATVAASAAQESTEEIQRSPIKVPIIEMMHGMVLNVDQLFEGVEWEGEATINNDGFVVRCKNIFAWLPQHRAIIVRESEYHTPEEPDYEVVDLGRPGEMADYYVEGKRFLCYGHCEVTLYEAIDENDEGTKMLWVGVTPVLGTSENSILCHLRPNAVPCYFAEPSKYVEYKEPLAKGWVHPAEEEQDRLSFGKVGEWTTYKTI